MSRERPPEILHRYPILQAVYDHLGRSTLYTDYHGSFSRALQVAQDECNRLRPTGGTYLAAALLGCGIVRVLQGDSRDAVAALREAITLGAADPPLRMLAWVYIKQARQIQYDLVPDHGPGTSAKDVQRRYNALEEYQRWLSETSDLIIAHGDQSVALEAQVMQVHHILRTFPRRRFEGNVPSFDAAERRYLAAWRENYETLASQDPNPAALAHLQILLAKQLTRIGQQDQARECERAAQRLGAEFQDPLVAANLNLARGDQLIAPLSSPEVWNCLLEEGTYDSSVHVQLDLAETATRTNDWPQAREYYRAALDLFCSEGKPRGVAAVHLRWAYLHLLEGRGQTDFEQYWRAAKNEVDTAAHLFRAAGDALAVRLCQAQRALCAVGEGQVPEQRPDAAAIGEWGQSSGSFSYALGLGLFFARVGWRWLTETGDYERALACFRLAQSLFHALGAPLAEVQSMMDQTKVYQSVGDFPSFSHVTDVALTKCNTMMERHPNLAVDASSLAHWAAIQILGVATKKRAPKLVGRVRSYMEAQRRVLPPQPRAEMPNNPEALLDMFEHMLQASAAADGTGEHPNGFIQQMPPPSNSLLEVQLADADLYQQLYEGQGLVRAGHRDRARPLFEHVRAVTSSRPGPKFLYWRAITYAYEGDIDRAHEAYTACAAQELAALNKHVDNPLGDDARRGVAVRAMLFFCQIQSYAEAQRWLLYLENWPDWWKAEGSEHWLMMRRVAQVKAGTGDLSGALSAYEEAIRLFETRRRHLSIDELKVALAASSATQAMFFECARTLIDLQDRPIATTSTPRELRAKAFRVIEQGKSRGLLDLMGGGLVGRLSTAPVVDTGSLPLLRWRRQNALRATQCAQLEQALAAPSPDQTEIEGLRKRISQTEEELVKTENEIAGMGKSTRSVTAEVSSLSAVAGDLPEDTVILQYTFDSETLIGWAITQRGMIQVHRVDLEEYALDHAARRFHDRCANATMRRELDASGQELARILLDPFVDILPPFRRIIVIPHGALHLVPFHALPFGEDSRPLGFSHLITYLPSASIRRCLHPKKARGPLKTVLVLGNPSNMPAGSLPGAEKEAWSVSEAMRGAKTLIGPAATREGLFDEVTRHSILHLATHCRIVPDVPFLSAVSLANGKEFSILDLLDQHLNLELVVLSACQTGWGAAASGEDLVGFSRAFLAAGARAVLVSLWRVDDLATCQLFVKFYEALRCDLEPAEALHRAQLSLQGYDLTSEGAVRDITPEKRGRVADYSLPAYWAPFILISA